MDFENYFKTSGISGKVQKAIAKETAQALRSFCEQEPEFAQAIEQSGKTFQQCLDKVAAGAHTSLSDFEAYSKAVDFYFPGAKIEFRMLIDLIGQGAPAGELPPNVTTGQKSAEASLTLSFDSLLDF